MSWSHFIFRVVAMHEKRDFQGVSGSLHSWNILFLPTITDTAKWVEVEKRKRRGIQSRLQHAQGNNAVFYMHDVNSAKLFKHHSSLELELPLSVHVFIKSYTFIYVLMCTCVAALLTRSLLEFVKYKIHFENSRFLQTSSWDQFVWSNGKNKTPT